MAFDAHKNLAGSTVAVAPSPATSGTSLTVALGQGSLFPTPPFNATIWPTGMTPNVANAEIVRVTNIAGDVFTITRMQEGTSARTVIVGDLIANTITAKVVTDVEAPRLIPIAHDDIPSGQTSSSGTLVDITGSTLTLANTVSAVLWVMMSVTLDLSVGSSTTIAVAVSIDGVDSNENTSFFSATGYQVLTKNECSGVSSPIPLSPGTHTVKGRYRVVSGGGTARIDGGEITAVFMQVL